MWTIAALLTKALSTTVKRRIKHSLTVELMPTFKWSGREEDQGPPRKNKNLFALCHVQMAKDDHCELAAICFEICE